MTDWEIAEFLAKELMGWNQYPWVIKGWSPCTRIDQALGDGGPGTVVEAMWGKSSWRISIMRSVGEGKDGFVAMFDINRFDKMTDWCFANIPARAICLAAVEALKGEE